MAQTCWDVRIELYLSIGNLVDMGGKEKEGMGENI